jgi:hypothetical protein
MRDVRRFWRGVPWVLAAVLAGCAGGEDPAVGATDEPQFTWQDDGGDEAPLIEKAGSCTTRYVPSAAVLAAGERLDVTYNGAGSRCSGGETAGARAFGNYMRAHFGSLMNLRVPGEGIQIYNCRDVVGGSTLSLHAVGRAIDVFIPTLPGGVANNAKGDQVVAWLVANAQSIGVQAIIWDRTYWRFDGRAPRCYTGENPHYDHVHVELNLAAAQKRTPFFGGAATNDAPVDDGGGDVSCDDASGGGSGDAWVGDPCRADADCGFTSGQARGRCFLDHRPQSGVGFCTLPCAGFCPDRGGKATTFCAEAEAVGGASGTGTCVSRADAENDDCRRDPGFVTLQVSRFVGNSSASETEAKVCAPQEVLGFDPGPSSSPPPAPSPGNDVCDDRSLPPSENGFSCAGVPAETWRCACSSELGTTVSQVCRNGAWLNFQTDPRDCSRCNGRYTSGCND